MKSRNEMEPSRAMRSVRRSSREDNGRSIIFSRCARHTPSGGFSRLCRRHGSRLRLTERPPADPRGLFRRRLRLRGAFPRGLEGGRPGPGLLRAGLRLGGAPAGRSADGCPRAPTPVDRGLQGGRFADTRPPPRPGRPRPSASSWPGFGGALLPSGAPKTCFSTSSRRGDEARGGFRPPVDRPRSGFGRLRQEGGRIRLVLVPVPAAPGGWQAESASLESWMAAEASEPLFEEVGLSAGLAQPHRAFLPNAARNRPIPGEHMPPGAAVLDFDGDGLRRPLRGRRRTGTISTGTTATGRSTTWRLGRESSDRRVKPSGPSLSTTTTTDGPIST